MVELNIFTNSIFFAPETHIIEQTYRSFIKKFGKISNIRVWYHPYPNIEKSKQYKKNLKKIFKNIEIIETQSLSDGYIKAIKSSILDFMFMLEHDWEFLDTIIHSLEEIIFTMRNNNLWHLRFNKRWNKALGCDKWIEEKQFEIPVCFTSCISNNPHIINKNLYIKKALPMIKKSETSKGIEGNISNKGISATIYGPLNYPPTIRHLDGRGIKK